jgi:hypothetical protein
MGRRRVKQSSRISISSENYFAYFFSFLYLMNSISGMPSFPGLRRFTDGHDFHQWTGDDSKALMKV